MPKLTGVDHVTLSVTDLDRSEAFYTRALGLVRLMDFGDVRVLIDPETSFRVSLAQHEARRAGSFSELNVGLDHVGLGAASRAELEEWVARFDAAGVSYTPIRDLPFGHHLNFRDPDGIPWEFYVPTPAVTEGYQQLRERDVSPDEIQAYVQQALSGSPGAVAASPGASAGGGEDPPGGPRTP